MGTKLRSNRLRVTVAMAAALVLSGCGLLEDRAETTTDVGEEQADRLAQLEAELRALRDGTDPEEVPPAEESAPVGEGSEAEEDEAGTVSAGEPVEPRIFEVNETQTNSVGDLEVTVERIIVHDYHVEVELTAVNDHPEADRQLWQGFNFNSPQLFDEQDRRFAYRHPAGYNSGDSVQLEPGQRLEAVMVFGRRLHPDARVLTLRFTDRAIDGWEWTVDLAEAER
jgi:hypothetical protein